MSKQCNNCNHAEQTLINLVCTNDKSEYEGEFVANNNLCKCWEGEDNE